MTVSLSLVIPGRPPTKKNSRTVVGGKIVGVSKSYKAYHDFCIGTKRRPGWLCQWGNIQFEGPVHVKADYWLPNYANWPDLVGLLQASGDILEAGGLIENDRNIVSWDGSRIAGIDRDNPRAMITIVECDQPEWWRRGDE